MNFLQIITSQEFINFLAVLAFISSAITIISNYIKNRKNFDIELNRYLLHPNHTVIEFLFINKSYLPISFFEISLVTDNKTIVGTKSEELWMGGKNPKYLANMPITCEKLSSARGYIRFSSEEAIELLDSTHLTFLISSSRGKVLKTTLELNPLLNMVE